MVVTCGPHELGRCDDSLHCHVVRRRQRLKRRSGKGPCGVTIAPSSGRMPSTTTLSIGSAKMRRTTMSTRPTPAAAMTTTATEIPAVHQSAKSGGGRQSAEQARTARAGAGAGTSASCRSVLRDEPEAKASPGGRGFLQRPRHRRVQRRQRRRLAAPSRSVRRRR